MSDVAYSLLYFHYRYSEKLGRPVQAELYKLLGYNPTTNRFRDGLMVDTDEKIVEGLIAYLERNGVESGDATKFAHDNFFRYNASSHITVPQDNPQELFKLLREYGVKIAVCTSDSEPGNNEMISSLGLTGLIDYSLCGDNELMKPKPFSGNINVVCDRLGVKPEDTMMVGDSLRDMEMGRGANIRATIGVLTGVCEEEDLKGKADYIVPSVKHVLQIAVPKCTTVL